jgi:hypothetical protein
LHISPASTDASAKGLSKVPASVGLSLVAELDEDEPQATLRQAASRLRAGRDQAARVRMDMSISFEVDERRARTRTNTHVWRRAGALPLLLGPPIASRLEKFSRSAARTPGGGLRRTHGRAKAVLAIDG